MSRVRRRIHSNPFTVRGPVAVPAWRERFGREAPFALDIGFGDGGFTLGLAQAHPDWNVVGIEIRDCLVDYLASEAKTQNVANLVALKANANVHLDELFPDGQLIFVSINHPDPWYKQRHHKRRVVTDALVETLVRKLRADGEIHAQTDYEPIGQEILATFERNAQLKNAVGPGQFAASSTTGIVTEREVHHASRGEPIYRMRFVKVC